MPRELNFGRAGVPIEACWRCPNCNTINVSSGELVFWHEKKEIIASKTTRIILDPRRNATLLQNSLKFKYCKNKECSAKPKWAKTRIHISLMLKWYLVFAYVLLLSFFFSFFIVSFMDLKNNFLHLEPKPCGVALCICIFVGIFVGIVLFIWKKNYENRMKTLPKEYLPVIGTSDYLVVSYAKAHGKVIPTRQQAIAILSERYSNTNDE